VNDILIRGKGLVRTFKPEVHLRPDQKHSELKQHFATKTCVRELVSYLEHQAAKNPQRFVFDSIKSIVKHCNGKYRTSKKPYSQVSVEKMLGEIRKLGILSERKRMLVDFNGYRDYREGWQLARHDDVCELQDSCCIFSVAKAKGWLRDSGGMAAGQSRDGGGMVAGQSRDSLQDSKRDSTDSLHQRANTEDVHASDAVLQSDLQPSLVMLVSYPPVSMRDTGSPLSANAQILNCEKLLTDYDEPQPPDHPLRVTEQPSFDEDLGVGVEEIKSDSTGGSDSREEPRARGLTVGAYFANGRDILDLMSDGEFNRDFEKKYKRWDELEDACREAVKGWQRVPMQGRRTLFELMGKAVDIMQRANPEYSHNPHSPSKWLIPPGWYKAKGILKHGGELMLQSNATAMSLWDRFVADESHKYETTEARMSAWDEYERSHV
jgi:hypothetical protein